MILRKSLIAVVASMLAASVLVCSALADALVQTDRENYAVGDTVVITGSGWWAGEVVSLTVQSDTVGTPRAELEATADETGWIENREMIILPEDQSVGFRLLANGESSGLSAEALFYDGPYVSGVSVTAAPPPISPGASAGYTVYVYGLSSWFSCNGRPTGLSITSGLPPGATWSFSPSVVTPSCQGFWCSSCYATSSLTITTSPSTPGGTYPFTIQAYYQSTDYATCTGSITVVAVNQRPVLASIPNQTIDEGVSFSLAATATDPNAPPQVLTYSLDGGGGLPAFMTKWGSLGTGDGQFNRAYGTAVDAAGNIYVADGDNHRIQKFSSSGAFLAKWGSPGTGDGQFNTPAAVAIDAAGNIYVSEFYGHRIQKFTSNGAFLAKWGSNGSGSGQFARPFGMAFDADGNLLVADTDNHRIQKFSTSGVFLAAWGSYGSGNGQFNRPHGVAVDAAGNVYVTDVDNHRIQKFTGSGAFIMKWGSYGSGDGQFWAPPGVVADAAGNVYVADNGNHRIQKFTSAGVFLGKWGSNGSGDGQFTNPHGVTFDGAGRLYVADTYNHRIQVFVQSEAPPAGASINLSTGLFTWTPAEAQGPGSYNISIRVSDNGSPSMSDVKSFSILVNEVNTAPGLAPIAGQMVDEETSFSLMAVATDPDMPVQALTYSLDSGGPPTFLTKWGSLGAADGQFQYPFGNAVDAAGNVYVADVSNNRIQKFSSSGTFLTKWGSAGSGDGQFNNMRGLETDAAGNVYVADHYNHRIQKFTSDGIFLTKWGSYGSGDGQFRYVYGLAVDPAGDVYVADEQNNRIQKFTSDGTFLAKWGSLGTGDGQLSFPTDVAVDAAGNVYVADWGNSRVQKFTGSGTFLTKWGSPGTGDGQFQSWSIAVDASGNVYVADADNSRIQKFTSSGTLLAKWGSNGTGDGQFYLPYWVTTDATGKVYVTDTGNGRIQVFTPSDPPPAGTSINPSTGLFTWTPAEAQGPGSYNISVRVTDNGSPPMNDVKSFSIIVNEVNRAPVITAINDRTLDEETLLTFTASATDPDIPANSLTYSLGSGTPEGAAIDGSTGVLTWTPTEGQGPGDYLIEVVVSDNAASPLTGLKSFFVHVNDVNKPPVLAFLPDQSVDEEALFTLTVLAADPDVPVNGLVYSLLSGPDGMILDGSSGVITWIPPEAAGPETYSVRVRVTDNGTPPLTDEQEFAVDVREVNLPPVLTVPGPITVDEGATIIFTAEAGDPDEPSNTLAFSLADPVPAGAEIDPATGAVTWPTVDSGAFDLNISVNDGHGGADEGTVAVTINNMPPVVTITGPASGSVVPVGTPVTFSGTFTDPGSADTHTAQWILDATTVAGTVDEAQGTVTGAYTFTAAGVYLVSLKVTDDDGGEAVATQIGDLDAMVVVYDPNAGFVTGGGWIMSLPGAYIPNPLLTGKANFGFVSKYKKGAAVPTGETEFQFKAGTMNFNSTVYEWLVIAGAKAQYKGSGKINGAGNFGFMLTAIDGEMRGNGGSDLFRIKITDKATGLLVYDNQLGDADTSDPTTALGGGSIVIHTTGGSGGGGTLPMSIPVSSTPAEYRLYQNSPNPFTSTTAIHFEMPEAAQVRLVIYDVAGRVVRTLIDEARDAGNHEAAWDGRSDDGIRVRSGVYFCAIAMRSSESGKGLSALKKMVILN